MNKYLEKLASKRVPGLMFIGANRPGGTTQLARGQKAIGNISETNVHSLNTENKVRKNVPLSAEDRAWWAARLRQLNGH